MGQHCALLRSAELSFWTVQTSLTQPWGYGKGMLGNSTEMLVVALMLSP